MKKMKKLGWGGAALLVAMAGPLRAQEVQYVSGSGGEYSSQVDEKNLVAEARKKLEADPTNVDLLIALGDAHAAVWNHKASIAVYDRAFALAPGKPLLHQQRGHRYLSIREFKKARPDLSRTASATSTSVKDVPRKQSPALRGPSPPAHGLRWPSSPPRPT